MSQEDRIDTAVKSIRDKLMVNDFLDEDDNDLDELFDKMKEGLAKYLLAIVCNVWLGLLIPLQLIINGAIYVFFVDNLRDTFVTIWLAVMWICVIVMVFTWRKLSKMKNDGCNHLSLFRKVQSRLCFFSIKNALFFLHFVGNQYNSIAL